MHTSGRLHDHAGVVPLVLGLACRHSQLGGNLQAVCTLLRVSKAVQQAVVDACSGPGNSQLQLCMEGGAPLLANQQARQQREAALQAARTGLQRLQHINHQARWIVKYGRLVKQLTLSGGLGLKGADEAVMGMAVRPPVQLQALTLAVTRPLQYPAALLKQLDGSHLTSLSTPIVGADGPAAMAAALARLTSLQSLAISAAAGPVVQLPIEGYGSTLLALTRLTELSLRTANLTPLLQHLPSSVVKLHLTGGSDSPAVMQRLAGMQQLQHLELKSVSCSAAAVAALSGLSSLSHLSLGYCFDGDQVADSSEEDISSSEDDDSSEVESEVGSDEDDEDLDTSEEEEQAAAAAAAAALQAGAGAVWEAMNAAEADRSTQRSFIDQHAAAWSNLPKLRQLEVSLNTLTPGHVAALQCATSITSLQLRHWRQQKPFDLDSLLAPLKQLQRLCVFEETGRADAFNTSFGNIAGISHLVWCGLGLSPLARTQLTTAAQLRVLFVESRDVDEEGLEVMGHYMTQLTVLGVVVGPHVSLDGLTGALSGGRFPALQRLVVECAGGTRTEAWVVGCVAAVRPHLAVEWASFTAEGLHKYM